MIELALPAGTIKEAIAAFAAGADAVYFGMQEFSARRGAGNFTEEDLSRIRRYALDNGKRIYITVNTLVDDSDLGRLYDLLKTIDRYGCDGLIVQDLGVAAIVRRDFPSLPLHGSTQLAVHTESGVRVLKALGFERVVLSRELNIEEIRRIRMNCPDIELKVFIHGALCYGFSGLCMASHLITGRSANEGGCAQICRSWFYDETTGRKVYPFSLEDLDAGNLVRELMDAGIDSLKVEGRLKGVEYVEAVTRYYRAIIDRGDGEAEHHAVKVSFQRKSGPGYLLPMKPGRRAITTGPFPGHMGERIGSVLDQRGRKILVESERKIRPHDGLMVLLKEKGLPSPYRFPARVTEAIGNRAILMLPDNAVIPSGSALYMISDSTLNPKAPDTSLPLMKKDIPAEITIHSDSIEVEAGGSSFPYSCAVSPSERTAENEIRRIFSQSGENAVRLDPIGIANRSGMAGYYINPSDLKRIRRDVLSRLAVKEEDTRTYRAEAYGKGEGSILPDRRKLDGTRTPWNMEGVFIGGKTYLSFPAVRYNEEETFREMEERAGSVPSPMIGLNNIGDLAFAHKHPEYSYFADIYLYLPNREATALLKECVPSLVGGYLWVERSSYEEPWPFQPTIAEGYRPPLFISRSCYRHDGLGMPCTGCSRHHTFPLEQNGRKYTAFVDDCTTIVWERDSQKRVKRVISSI